MAIKIPFMNLNAQYKSIKDEIDEAVVKVLESGWYIHGEELEAFEQEFSSYCDVRFAAGVSSGTTAIQLALIACGVKSGDMVATVANVSAPTVAAIRAAGAKPVLVDICPVSYNMDPDNLQKTFAQHPHKNIKAVIPVHLYGNPAQMDRINNICREYGAKVIEDACQAHGALYQNKKTGGLGHAGCFSFYPTKNLGAFGDAGMVVSDDPSLIEKVKSLRNYGEQSKYCNTAEGINGRMEELQAAVLRVKLRHLDHWNNSRQLLASTYSDRLAGSGLQLPQVLPGGCRQVFHLYVVKSSKRDELKEKLALRGIATSIHYPCPIHFQPAYVNLGYSEGSLPHTELCCKEVLSIPLYPEMDLEQAALISDSILDCL
jgi:dTDP-4-amino-4,6-dideoxygalactose transaminase